MKEREPRADCDLRVSRITSFAKIGSLGVLPSLQPELPRRRRHNQLKKPPRQPATKVSIYSRLQLRQLKVDNRVVARPELVPTFQAPLPPPLLATLTSCAITRNSSSSDSLYTSNRRCSNLSSNNLALAIHNLLR